MTSLEDMTARVIRDYRDAITQKEEEIAVARRILAEPGMIRRVAEWRLGRERSAPSWERDDDRAGLPLRLWGGSVTDMATGEGVTITVFMTWARSEGEFRRHFSLYAGPGGAGAAQVGDVLDEDALGLWLMLPPGIEEQVRRIARGEDAPSGFSWFARFHLNKS